MIPQFEVLNDNEKELMFDAIPLITILIAAADGNIEEKELKWADKIADIRTYSAHESLRPYYEQVDKRFVKKVREMINELPDDNDDRLKEISHKLSGLNNILPKIKDNNFTVRFYKSLLTFAEQVAKASGGFLGMGAISREEKVWLGLDMINPVTVVHEPEESEETEETKE